MTKPQTGAPTITGPESNDARSEVTGTSGATDHRIGMALYGDLTFDSRVRREAAVLAEAGYRVRLICLADSGDRSDLPSSIDVVVYRPSATGVFPGVSNPELRLTHASRGARAIGRMRWLVAYARNLRAWGREVVRLAGPVDAWHAHDLPGVVAIAPNIAADVPLIYDSHELFLNTVTTGSLPGPARRLLRAYEARLIRRAHAVVTVSVDLAQVLEDRYHPVKMIVVHNCPPRWEGRASQDLLRAAAAIPPDAPVVLYHGSIGPGRGIEPLLEALGAPGLEGAHLVLLGPGDHRGEYAAISAGPRFQGRAHVLPGVPPRDLLNWVWSADVSGVLRRNSCLNDYLSTPNKLFESIAAGVPVVASDYPAMRRIVQGDPLGPLGMTVDPANEEAIAVALTAVLTLDPAAREALRARCREAARERWNWEVQSSHLVDLYRELLPPLEPSSRNAGRLD